MGTNSPALNQKVGELWSTNTRDKMADVYLPYVVNVRSAYANALDFSPRDFATWNFTSP